MKKSKKEEIKAPVSDIFFVKIDEVKIGDRIRSDIGDLEELKKSIKKHGQLNPILVDEKMGLIAGERRYRAMKELGHQKIQARILLGADDYTKHMLEVEENSTRKDFTYVELQKAMKVGHLLFVKRQSLFRYLCSALKHKLSMLFRR